MSKTNKEDKQVYDLINSTYNDKIVWLDNETHFIGKVLITSWDSPPSMALKIWLVKLNGEIIYDGELQQVINTEQLDLLTTAIQHGMDKTYLKNKRVMSDNE